MRRLQSLVLHRAEGLRDATALAPCVLPGGISVAPAGGLAVLLGQRVTAGMEVRESTAAGARRAGQEAAA